MSVSIVFLKITYHPEAWGHTIGFSAWLGEKEQGGHVACVSHFLVSEFEIGISFFGPQQMESIQDFTRSTPLTRLSKVYYD